MREHEGASHALPVSAVGLSPFYLSNWLPSSRVDLFSEWIYQGYKRLEMQAAHANDGDSAGLKGMIRKAWETALMYAQGPQGLSPDEKAKQFYTLMLPPWIWHRLR